MSRRVRVPGGPLSIRLCRVLLALACVALMGVPQVAAAQSGGPNRAGLAVRYEDGRLETRCVEFQEAEITGADLLARSGLDAVVDASSGLGITVCRIEGQGCDYPAQPCFCQCSGTGTCAYWNYYYRDAGSTGWTYAPLGALLHKVKAGSVDAWLWGNGQSPPPADLTFESVCPVPAPAAATVTVAATVPAALAPTVVAVATVPPTPAGGHSQPTSAPAPGAQNMVSYVLFGIMALGLLLAGAFVWLRGKRR